MIKTWIKTTATFKKGKKRFTSQGLCEEGVVDLGLMDLVSRALKEGWAIEKITDEKEYQAYGLPKIIHITS